jgi:hypothetical protein
LRKKCSCGSCSIARNLHEERSALRKSRAVRTTLAARAQARRQAHRSRQRLVRTEHVAVEVGAIRTRSSSARVSLLPSRGLRAPRRTAFSRASFLSHSDRRSSFSTHARPVHVVMRRSDSPPRSPQNARRPSAIRTPDPAEQTDVEQNDERAVSRRDGGIVIDFWRQRRFS